ncbi:hypothetical protein [Mycolicibacter arupensis]|uniref:hypothetical protein n=1 Tax=Mycolicibacter arupensis TaxID=342002 RepID=UPI00122C39CF|nr:hypothetical protein [Mycolicibacter arupensis]KAA1430917.1 hypothetical protein F0402_11585 [Mycolicibacter arupensis]
MAQHYPPYPPYPYGGFPPPTPPPRRAWDVVSAGVLAILLLPACGFGLIYSMFAGMATDVCSSTRQCSDSMIGGAYLVAWGGMAAALLLTVVGLGVSARRRSRMVIWPALGWATFLITFVAGGVLLNAGVGG